MSGDLSKRLKVVLVHAPNDAAAVSHVYNRLKKVAWIDVWFGDEKLMGGQERNRAIKQAVEGADIVVMFLSTLATTTKGYIQKDIRVVMDKSLYMPEGTTFVIPVRLDDCEMPFDLDRLVPIEYFPPAKKSKAYNKLLNSLKNAAESMEIKTSRVPATTSQKDKSGKAVVPQKAGSKIPTSKQTTYGGRSVYILGKMEFVKIPAGSFVMGSGILNPLAYPDERPQLEELIPYDYFIGRYPVTIAQYVTFVEWNQYEHEWVEDLSTKQNHPVTCVTWNAAKDYCKWLNRL